MKPKPMHGTSKAEGCEHTRLGNFCKLIPGLPTWAEAIGIKHPCEAEHITAVLGSAGGIMHDARDESPDSDIPAGYTFFAQFIDHDITLDTTSPLHGPPLSDDAINKEGARPCATPCRQMACTRLSTAKRGSHSGAVDSTDDSRAAVEKLVAANAALDGVFWSALWIGMCMPVAVHLTSLANDLLGRDSKTERERREALQKLGMAATPVEWLGRITAAFGPVVAATIMETSHKDL